MIFKDYKGVSIDGIPQPASASGWSVINRFNYSYTIYILYSKCGEYPSDFYHEWFKVQIIYPRSGFEIS